jgi:hypothetical protein
MDPIVSQMNPLHSYPIPFTSILIPSPNYAEVFHFISYLKVFRPKCCMYTDLHHVMKYQTPCLHNPIYILNIRFNTVFRFTSSSSNWFLTFKFSDQNFVCTRTYTTPWNTNHRISLISILILVLSSHLRLGLPASRLPWSFPTENAYA